jgi:multiple sugar transport system substrate-binding protein
MYRVGGSRQSVAKSLVGVFLAGILAIAPGLATFAATSRMQLASYGGPMEVEGWQNVALLFTEANPDIKVDVQIDAFGVYNEKLLTQIATGLAPDLMQTWAQYKPKFVELGILRDVTQEWSSSGVIKKARLYPFAMEAPRSAGRLYGIPMDYNSLVWYANLDYLSESGVNRPTNGWTVEDLRILVRKLTNPQKRVYGTLNPVARAGTHAHQWTQLWTGQDWVSDDRRKALVDSPENLDMLAFWYELQNSSNATPGWPGGWAAIGTFYQGGYALYADWLTYAAGRALQFTFDWAFAPMPKAPAGQLSFAQGHLMSIPVDAKNPEAAWRMAEWLMSYEGQKALVRELKYHPCGPYVDLWNEFFQLMAPEQRNHAREWVMSVFYGGDMVRTMDYWTSYPEVNDIMTEHVSNIFARQAPIGNEMRNAALRIQNVLDGK